ncbi:ATP-binding protein [Curtanaerobium respiraculi]|uniref:ATP-binding protein n=1 Tax=Curtanaerobium respiraculi TaxID=2949669 RepID=UPI0024B39AA4|nr:ATP-binding protein [Curtanaerobium respiraculi]
MPDDIDEEFSYITPEEAKQRGLNAPKGDDECPWCGRRLEARGVILNGRVAWVSRERCGCEGEMRAEKAAEAREEAAKERERKSKLVRAGVKKRYIDAKVDTAETQAYVERFGSDEGRGLYIHGDVGTGKTYLANALARVFITAGYNVVLTTAIEMLGSIQDTYGNEDSTAVAVQRYSKCDVLILDDLGKESGSSWSVSTLFQIINHRYEAMRPLIVTSQYDLATLEKRIARRGERESARAIVSRLGQMCHDVHLAGGDRRRR